MEAYTERHMTPTPPDKRPAPLGAAAYQPLHLYLKGRFADTVVLTFAQIEDLIGVALPDGARLEREWWADADAAGTPSVQARSWVQAHRTATPNLGACNVTFVRGS
jgi:hypothetical protein